MIDVPMSLVWARGQYGRFLLQFLGPSFREDSLKKGQNGDGTYVHHAFRNILFLGVTIFAVFMESGHSL